MESVDRTQAPDELRLELVEAIEDHHQRIQVVQSDIRRLAREMIEHEDGGLPFQHALIDRWKEEEVELHLAISRLYDNWRQMAKVQQPHVWRLAGADDIQTEQLNCFAADQLLLQKMRETREQVAGVQRKSCTLPSYGLMTYMAGRYLQA